MKNPYLIQRLQKPYKTESNLFGGQNPFSFGGGYKNGGLSDDAMTLLNKIWQYDYMGSSEFEWGAVPKSLQSIIKNISNYITGEIEVIGKYNDYQSGKNLKESSLVYYVCLKDDEKDVCEWINKFADDKKRDYHTKESVNLAGTICKQKYYLNNGGWHDIDNHYLFFTDKEMFENFCMLFEFKVNTTV